MKKYDQLGNRLSKPAYRTPALFRYRQYLKVQKTKVSKNYKKNK